jgi:tripartite-type tricarboxylate transporter receptor subunit TctC
MPDLPPIAEAGVPGYSAGTWYGLFLPARTPAPIVDRLSAALKAVLAAPAIQALMAKQGAEATWDTPQEFSAYTAEESAKWGKLIHELNIKVE